MQHVFIMANMTLSTVLEIVDGNYCPLKLKMVRQTTLPDVMQYYRLRHAYCNAKFNEVFASKPARQFDHVPASIISYWNTCEQNLRTLVAEKSLSFSGFEIRARDAILGDITIDARGSIDGMNDCIFTIVFGSWRKKHAMQLVVQMTAMVASGLVPDPSSVTLVALLVGGDEGTDINKMYRVIPRESTFTKTGNVKEEGWDALKQKFDEAVIESNRVLDDVLAKNNADIDTNPQPLNCSSCPVHNTIVLDGHARMTCVGYYRPAP